MSQLDQWEQEKVQRLLGKGAEKEDMEQQAPAGAQEPPPEAEDSPRPSAHEDNLYAPPGKVPPSDNFKNAFTVKLSVIMAFLISALVVMPLCLVPAAWLFKGEAVRGAAIFMAFLALYPIRRALERLRWPGDRRIGVIALILAVVGGGFLAVLLFMCVGLMASQKEAARAVERKNIISEKQLPLAGYEHEKQTAKYLKKVREIRASIEPPPRQDRERWYADYKHTYVEPLTDMGYEFDVTLKKATDRYGSGHLHRRTGDELEFLVFNGVCFREKLLSEGLISPDTGNKLFQIAFVWSQRLQPEEGEPPPANELALFESRCPISDLSSLFPAQGIRADVEGELQRTGKGRAGR